jgi:hypothetical protein
MLIRFAMERILSYRDTIAVSELDTRIPNDSRSIHVTNTIHNMISVQNNMSGSLQNISHYETKLLEIFFGGELFLY